METPEEWRKISFMQTSEDMTILPEYQGDDDIR